MRRSGFTLLEMVLALAIGVVVLTGLYWALDSQIRQSQSGRDTVDEGKLARGILTSISKDILGHLGDPQSAGDSSGSSNATGSSSSGGSSTMASTQQATIQVNLGVKGEANRLILSVTRLPRELIVKANNQQQQTTADLRRITYWLLENGGLARQEIRAVTSEEADTAPPDVADPEKYSLAPEVTSLEIGYFDGSAWQTEWSGASLGGPLTDIPIGAPCAISITIKIRRPRSPANQDPGEVVYRHVVAIPTANGFGQSGQ
jgi:prepilin-type N-terminal cleavage/methylation domain-containing protein